MHEKILQGVTVGVVAGLIVYWFTSRHSADCAGKNTTHSAYRPLLGDVRTVHGTGTCACCQCCGLTAPESTTSPLAADYLCNSPQYAPTVSKWNLGVSLQWSCAGIDLDSTIHRNETATSFPHGLGSNRTTPRRVRMPQKITCSPQVPACVQCTEVV